MNMLSVGLQQAGYSDRPNVIYNVDFQVRPGELVGLIGPNGAGKSTTIKAVLGLLPKVQGKVQFNGPHGNYSYIPEQPIYYEELTLWEHLELASAAYGMDNDEFRRKAEDLLLQFRLKGAVDQLPGSFSKGMLQKMMLIIGFLLEPDIYIVDEPFIGLDPKAIKDFLARLQQEKERGAGILMSTHVLDTAEKICDSFLLMNEGTIVAYGDLQQIRKQCGMPDASLFDCFHSFM